jgi:biotin carboxylase
MTTGRVLLVGMGTMGRAYLDRVHRRGLAGAVVDRQANLEKAREVLTPDDTWFPVTERGDEAWYAAVTEALADGAVDGVLAFAEPHVMAAALVASELGLPGPGLLAATVSRNKLFSRHLLARHGLLQPRFGLAYGADSALEWAAGRSPLVLKPLSSQGSSGVRVAYDADDVRAWVDAESPAAFLVEEYLPGPEYSAEAVVADGRVVFTNVTGKVTTRPPYCVELAHQVPAACPTATRQAIEDLARAVVAAVRMAAGIMHLEVKVEPRGVHVVEFAVRTPGDHIMDLIHLATGVDIFDAVVATALGVDADLTASRSGVACAWYPELPPGLVASVEGLDAIAALPGVAHHWLSLQPGDEIAALRSSNERFGPFILTAADHAELSTLLGKVQQTLDVRLVE